MLDNNKALKQNLMISIMFVVLAQLITGVNITTSKYLIESLPILFLVESRFIIAVFSLGAIFIFASKTHKQREYLSIKSFSKKQWLVLIGQALGGGAFFNLLMMWGVKYTSASMAGVITSSLPAMVIIFMFFMLGIKLTRRKLICVGLAVAGLFIININGVMQPKISAMNLVGDLIIFLAMVPEAMYYVLSKALPLNIKPLTASIMINIINAILLIPFLFFLHYGFLSQLSLFEWSLIFLLGITSGLFYLFWSKGCEVIDASTSGMITALMPVFTLILSWLFLNEIISLVQMLAMLLIIASIFVGNWKKSTRTLS
jgi:drug/metabolite transporter (DMT)-like permease